MSKEEGDSTRAAPCRSSLNACSPWGPRARPALWARGDRCRGALTWTSLRTLQSESKGEVSEPPSMTSLKGERCTPARPHAWSLTWPSWKLLPRPFPSPRDSTRRAAGLEELARKLTTHAGRRLRPACRSILTAAAALFASSRGRGGPLTTPELSNQFFWVSDQGP